MSDDPYRVQPQDQGQPQYQAPGYAWAPVPGAPKPKHRAAWVVGIASIVVIAVAVTGGLIMIRRNNGSPPSAPWAGVNANVIQAKEQLGVNRKKTFTYRLGFDLDDPSMASVHGSDVLAVYLDPALTILAPGVRLSGSGHTVTIDAPSHGVVAYSPAGAKAELGSDDGWGFSEQYFIVQKRDFTTGDVLDRPVVTRFTAKVQGERLPVPAAVFAVDANGVGHFTWSAVDGAEKYYVVQIVQEDAASQGPRDGVKIIAETTTTEWTSVEGDTSGGDGSIPKDSLDSTQNRLFETVNYSQDNLRNPGFDFAKLTVSAKAYGVVAVAGERTSALSPVGGPNVAAMLPCSFASVAAGEMGVGKTTVTTFDEIPTQFPVSMCDGSTVVRPVLIDTGNITPTIFQEYEDDDAGKRTWGRQIPGTRVHFTVGGTRMSREVSLAVDGPSVIDEVNRIAQRNRDAQVRTGGELPFGYTAERVDVGASEVSATAPTVPYQVNGTNELTTYLAANLIAGERLIDVSAYMRDGSSGAGLDVAGLWDAFNEARSQNPYVPAIKNVNYGDDRKVVTVTYTVTSQETRDAEQKAISAEVDRVVAEIITPDMTDEAKVRAINTYIATTAEYNYAALNASETDALNLEDFRDAWSATGILIDKTAVCAGYAIAFKALADKTGLESMYVSGTANGSGHAWNKVKIGGAWRVVDVTWNDSPAAPDKYLLLTDAQAAESRTQGPEWVIDSMITNYAAS